MKKRYIILILLVCLVVAFFCSDLPDGLQGYKLLSDLWAQNSGSADISVNALQLQADWLDIEGKRILRIGQAEGALYLCDGVLYLENGKAYTVETTLPESSSIPWLTALNMEREGDTWAFALETEELGTVNLTMQAGENGPEILSLSAEDLTAQAVIHSDREPMTVPQAVLDAIAAGQAQDLTESLLRLMQGWAALSSRNPLAMDLALSADCGILNFNQKLNIYRTVISDFPIYCVEKSGYGLYFTGETVCTADGTVLTGEASTVESAKILGLVYSLCFNGDLVCNGDTFSLTLDQAGMEALAYTIAPEAEDLNITFTSGSLNLTMAENTIQSIQITCAGTIDMILTQIQASIGAALTFPEENVDFTLPEAVIQTLTGN